MELLIVAGFAVAGYELTKKNKIKQPPRALTHPTKPKQTPKPSTIEQHPVVRETTSRNRMIREDQLQSKMERLTGSDATYMKRGVTNFEPQKNEYATLKHDVTHASIARETAEELKSLNMDGVPLMEAERVVPAFNNSGIHNTMRVKPRDVNAYRRTQLSARPTGQTAIAKGPVEANVQATGKRGMSNSAITGVRAAYTQSAVKSEVVLKDTQQLQSTYNTGIKGNSAPGLVNTQYSQTHRQQIDTLPVTNANQQSAGSYYKESMLLLPVGNRGNKGSTSNPHNGNAPAMHTSTSRGTQRGDCPTYAGHATSGHTAATSRLDNVQTITQRGTGNTYSGAPRTLNATQHYNGVPELRKTQKDLGGSACGPAQSVHSAPSHFADTEFDSECNKPESQQYTPAGGRMNIRQDPSIAGGKIEQSCKQSVQGTFANPARPTAMPTNMPCIEQAEKISEINTRADFQLYK